MEFENAKIVWQNQSEVALPIRNNRQVTASILARLKELDRFLVRRDAREIGAATAGILAFGYWFFTIQGVVARIGAAVMVAGSILIIAKLFLARSVKRGPQYHFQMQEFCVRERARIETQIRLLRSVPWWYLGPTLLGSNLFVFGFTGWNAVGFGYFAFSLALGIILYNMNVLAVRRQLVPVREELDSLLAEIGARESSTEGYENS